MNLVLPRPHPAQYEVLRASKRFNVLCCGRRWGKTTIAIDRLVRPALKGKPVSWFAPTYKLLSEVWRAIHVNLAPVTVRKNESEKWIELIGGGTVNCWSLDDPDAGRGRAYARIVIDEAALVPNLEQAWERSISPMLIDYRGGAWFISTPRGIANYFHTLYQHGQDPLYEDWASWRMPSSLNPHLPPEEIEKARKQRTELAFAQEYLAQFVSWTGTVFRRIDAAVRPIQPQQASIIGVDWGLTTDFTVFIAMDRIGQVVAMERFRGVEYIMQRDRLTEFWKRLGSRAWIIAETNSMGGPIVNELQHERLPVLGFNTNSASKPEVIRALALAFERGTIAIPNDIELIGELQAYEGKPGPSGIMKYNAPAGVHDDCVMALAMAWAGLTAPEQRQQFLNPRTGAWGSAPVPYQISPI